MCLKQFALPASAGLLVGWIPTDRKVQSYCVLISLSKKASHLNIHINYKYVQIVSIACNRYMQIIKVECLYRLYNQNTGALVQKSSISFIF